MGHMNAIGQADQESQTRALDGRQFIAQGTITDPVGLVLASAGDTCERVPTSSLTWLLEQGYIRPTVAVDGE